jgi:hypothetical protein
MRSSFRWALVAALAVIAAAPTSAQRAETFTAVLGWVPIGGAERNDVAGDGKASATLTGGSKLTVTGSFEGLPAAVTGAKLHLGVAKGARGPAFADLKVGGAANGTVAGEVQLTAEQVAALEAGRVYVQIYSEKGVQPDHSTLWGWLLR